MKTITLTAAAAVLALGAAGAAQAQEVRPYVGAGLGFIDGERADINTANLRLGADIGRHFGVEGEMAFGLNDDNFAGVDYELSHLLAGYGKLRAPLMQNVEGFARLGYYTAEISGTLPGGGGVTRTGLDTDGLAGGAGLQWNFTGSNAIRAEYTNYGFENEGHSGALSFVHKF